MRRPRPPLATHARTFVLLAVLAGGPATLGTARAASELCDDVRPVPAAAADVRAAALSESLFMATRVPEMDHVLADALGRARARHDAPATLWFLRRIGEFRARHGRASEAAPVLRETEALALELGDSLTLASALRWQAAVRNQQGDFAGSRALGERLRVITASTHDRVHAAWAEAVVAWTDIQDGNPRQAIASYRRGIATFRALGSVKDEIFMRNGLAIALVDAGEYEESRANLQRTLEITAGTIYRRAYAHALITLAHLEHDLGDPAAAAGYYQRAYEIFRERQALNEFADPLFGMAMAYAELGRFPDAEAALDTARAVAVAHGFRDEAGVERLVRARTALLAGRPHRALRMLDEVDAMGDTNTVATRFNVALVRAAVLEELGRRSESTAVLEALQRRLGPRASYDQQLDLQVRIARNARWAGDARDARERARKAAVESSRSGLRELSLAAWLIAAGAARDLGDATTALAELDSARAEWEALRGRPSAPEWRERRGALARDLIVETVDLQLASGPGDAAERTRAAYDALQRYKARTLLERVAGPHAAGRAEGALATATLARVQSALRPGELLLDYLVGEHRAFVFVVTPGSAKGSALRDATGLENRAALYRDLLASRESGEAQDADFARTLAARKLGSDLLGEAYPELTAARQVLVSPDGGLHLVPFATLEAPNSETGAWPLGERLSVTTVPSASLLLAVRGGPARPRGAMLAVADSLPGANAEARAVGGDVFRGRFVPMAGGRALRASDLEGSGAIHFAGHSVADDQSPWRSPVPFLHLDGGRVANAADLAALRLHAGLAVLSSCETVDGRVLSGEGVVGLSSAFLASGVPTVVASLWRVDDRATRRLMAAFYEALLWGAEPAAALRSAQRAVRNRPDTRHPFYWAGFVVIGDGSAATGLLPNPFSARTLSGYAAGAAVVGLIAVATRRFRRRKTVPPPV